MNRNNKKRNNQKQKKPNQQMLLENAMTTSLPKAWGGSSPFPPHMVRKLNYTSYGLLSGAAQFVVIDFCLNCADPLDQTNPVTAAYTGFSQLAGIYNICKATHSSIELQITNNEPSLPLHGGYVVRDLAPTTSYTTKVLCQNAFEVAPCSEVATLGLTQGVASHRFPTRKISHASIAGNGLAVYSDDSYQFSTTSSTLSPSNAFWLGLIGFSPSASNLTNGFFYKLKITTTFHFWSASDVVPQ